MAGTTSISGLSSGLDTADIVNQLLAVSRKRINVVVEDQTKREDKLAAYQSLNTQLLSFQSAADTLRDSDAFDIFSTTISSDSTNFKASELLSVSADEDASSGTHTIEFESSSQLAQARQISSGSFSSASSALGISGKFLINGEAVSISTTDSLSDIASLINNENSGTNATQVTAAVLSLSSTDNRLVLTSDVTGVDKFSILDASADSENILQSLGFTNSSTSVKNTTSDGAESDKLSSSTSVVGTLLGLSSANSGAVTIGTTETVSIDLSTQSLTDIASSINALTNVSASLESTTTDGVTTYFIDISGTTNFTDDENILETLGILEGQQGTVSEIVTAFQVNSDTGGSSITSSTAFGDIDTTGSTTNDISDSDTITLSGTTNNGTVVSETTYTITLTNTVDNFLTFIESAFDLGGTSATISGGQIVITDNTAGDSQLSINMVANNDVSNGSLNFGSVSVTTEGYSMETKAEQDAKVKIDGVAVTKSSNTIDDVISGVTIDLARVESGTAVTLATSRDVASIVSNVQDFISSYNSIIEFINQEFTFNEETETAGILSGETTLSSIKSIIQSTITSTNSMLSSGFEALVLVGIASDKYGMLSLDESEFKSELNTDFNAVKRLFIAEGTTTNSGVTFISHSKESVAGEYAVVINTVSTQASVTGTTDISAGLSANETLTITDTSTSRVATIGLTSGSSLTTIVSAINSELAAEYTEILVGSAPQTVSGGAAITSSTLFTDISDTSGWTAGDTFTYSGTTHSGISVSNSFSIDDTTTATVQDLLSAIESAYSNEISATIDTSGAIVITEDSVGDSQATLTISALNSLDFGTISTSNSSAATTGVEGRYAMEITASDDGTNLTLTHDTYGSNFGFSVSQTADNLGLSESSYSGVDVAGTINGEDATGSGQTLTGDAPPDGGSTSIEDLSIRVTSTSTGSKGDVKLTYGVAEEMYIELVSFTDSIDGVITIRTDGLDDTIENLQDTIDNMEGQLVTEKELLERQFTRLEIDLARLQNLSSFLSEQLRRL